VQQYTRADELVSYNTTISINTCVNSQKLRIGTFYYQKVPKNYRYPAGGAFFYQGGYPEVLEGLSHIGNYESNP
jgi:hypothetical protein